MRGPRADRAAAIAFGIVIVVAFFVIWLDLGRYRWFQGDEWTFLVDRDGGSLNDILRAHNEHIQVLPVIAWRVMWNLFGLRSYLPYQVPVLVLHLTAAVMLRIIMRKNGVNPWIASAAAAVFVFFGAGEDNIVWAFQIGFTGTLACGLAHLVLADHPGERIDRRDAAGLAVGLVGLLFSGLTPITTAIVGAVVLVRRGWRLAAFHVVPIATLYLLWWVTFGPTIIKDPYSDATATVGDIAQFVTTAYVGLFKSLGFGNVVVAWLLVAVLVGGLAVAYAGLPRRELVRQAILPGSMLLAGFGFILTSALGRWWIGDIGASSRYLHLLAAFTLPPLAIAADALARHVRYGVIVASIGFLAMVPYGVSQFDTNPPWTEKYFNGREQLVAALGRSEYLEEVPASHLPDPAWSQITAGWLRDARRHGDLPALRDRAALDNPLLRLRFGLAILRQPSPSSNCTPLDGPVDLRLQRGDEFGVKVGPNSDPPPGFIEGYNVHIEHDGKWTYGSLGLQPALGERLRADLDDLHIKLRPAPGTSLVLCR